MRILLLAPQPFLAERGTPIAVRAAAEALSDEGHRIDLLTYFAGRDVAIANAEIHRIPRPPLIRTVPIGLSWRKVVCDVLMLLRAHRMVGERDYDLVHAVEDGAFIAWLLHRRHGIPYVFDMDSKMSRQIEDRGIMLRPLGLLVRRMERMAIKDALGVLAVCPALVDYAREHHPSGPVALLPDMPLTASGEGPNASESASELDLIESLKILYVGNLEEYQGIDLLLESFALIAEEFPDVSLVIVGGSDEHLRKYRERADALLRDGRARFLGPRPLEQLGALLSGADILASPRRGGINTPMKIYSYMASGKPIIATRLCTHTQVLDDTVACLVEPSPPAMAEGLRRLVRSPEMRHRLGVAARNLVQEEYSPSRFRERLEEFYGRLPVARAG